MQIGVIGLGRMGANIVRRLQRGGHACVAYDADPAVAQRLAAEGLPATPSPRALLEQLAAPRVVWVMVPAGAPTEDIISQLGEWLQADDVIIDGGNTFYQDDIWRAAVLRQKGIHYLDVGTSGGVFGLERGFCLMIGGDRAVVERLDPIFATLAPAMTGSAALPGARGAIAGPSAVMPIAGRTARVISSR